MATVSRRIKRNMIAKRMAINAGVVPPPIEYRDGDGNVTHTHIPRTIPMILYRAIMLRIKAQHRDMRKVTHHQQQYIEARKEKRTRKPRNEGSMVRRFFRSLLGRKAP